MLVRRVPAENWGGGGCLLWGVNQCQALAACRPNPASAQGSARRGLAPCGLGKGTWKRCKPYGGRVRICPMGLWSTDFLLHRLETGSFPYLDHPPQMPSSHVCIPWVTPTSPWGKGALSGRLCSMDALGVRFKVIMVL